MKVTLSEIKKNYREPSVKGRKLGFKSMVWNLRKIKHLTRKARRKNNTKNKDSIRSLWDVSKSADF